MTVCRFDVGRFGIVGLIEMSGREMTAREPRLIGCSGSDIEAIKSYISCSSIGSDSDSTSLSERLSEWWVNRSLVEGGGYENIPTPFVFAWKEVLRFRVGRSEALRIVGFAFLPFSMVVE